MNSELSSCLVADDDPDVAELVCLALRADGHQVESVSSGFEVLSYFETKQPHVLILDVDMPGLSGPETALRIRESSDVGILMLTANGDNSVRLESLSTAADDYMTKPFQGAELRARVKALLRRTGPAVNAASSATAHDRVGNISVDTKKRKALIGDEELALTAVEFATLAELVAHAGQAVSKEQLIKAGWQHLGGATAHTLDVHIYRLRQKIEAVDAGIAIASVRGVGFQLLET